MAFLFQLTNEIVEVMDGEESDMFSYFKILMLQGLVAARKHQDRLLHIVEVMRPGKWLLYSNIPLHVCSFYNIRAYSRWAVSLLEERRRRQRTTSSIIFGSNWSPTRSFSRFTRSFCTHVNIHTTLRQIPIHN